MAKDNNPIMVSVNESTPLIGDNSKEEHSKTSKWMPSETFRCCICAFLVSVSFGVTQVPLIYVFRLMTCDAYYETHPIPPMEALPPNTDICNNHSIEADTARAVSLLGTSTTLFGILNLFLTSHLIKRYGVKPALLIQVFWPAVRLLIQNLGVMTGGSKGILIIQGSQIITIIGGPNGYLLALNAMVAEITVHKERTGQLGRLQGSMFFGMAVGFLAGGWIGEDWGIEAPFRVTLGLFLVCTGYVYVFLPRLPVPTDDGKMKNGGEKGVTRFLGPLKIFAPRKWVLPAGVVQRQYGALFLGLGAFLGVLATGYIPILLQMFSTDVFGFGTKENGLLIALHSVVRGFFLSFCFPRIIAAGRRWYERLDEKKREDGDDGNIAITTSTDPNKVQQQQQSNNNNTYGTVTPPKSSSHSPPSSSSSSSEDLPDRISRIDLSSIPETVTEQQDPRPPPPHHSSKPSNSPNSSSSSSSPEKEETYHFDLHFTTLSLLLDGLLTTLATLITNGWQIYPIALILPFASGTGAAAKGTMLQMCSKKERVDALSAITLVENVARLGGTAIFGLIFAAFADIGRTNLIFLCNGAVSLLGFVVIQFSRFPVEGSRRLAEVQGEEEGEDKNEDEDEDENEDEDEGRARERSRRHRRGNVW